MWDWGDRVLKTIKKWVPSKRKLTQLYFALLVNANLKGFVSGNIFQGNTKLVCTPGLNCYSCPGAITACPLGALQGAFSAGHSTLWYVGGILMLYGLMLGRVICGWLCPFGLIQELVYKLKTPKVKKSRVTRYLSWLKYIILVIFVFLVPILYAIKDVPLPAFCKYICPAGTLEGGVILLSNTVNKSYLSMLGPLFSWKFLLMLSTVVACVFIFRLFCRFLCPLGALYGLFNRISFFGVRLEKSQCIDCGKCLHVCKMDIHHVGDAECISCGECLSVCPTKAISWKGPKLFPKGTNSKKRLAVRIIAAVVMLGVLMGAIGYSWNIRDNRSAGNQVGDLCVPFALECIDANGATGETLDISKTGKVTVINFWGTWCSPCIEELPYFDRIAEEYKEDVCVVAIHSALSRETGPAFIGKYYSASAMQFAWDPGDGYNGECYTALGGRGTYPYTVILGQDGRIANIFVEKLTYEELKTAVKNLL